MKKIWRALPNFVRWGLVTLVLMVASGIGTWAYNAFEFTAEVTVGEALFPVGSTEFIIDFKVTESETFEVTVENTASNPIEFDLLYEITPDPGDKGFNVTYPNKMTAPALGTVVILVEVEATKSAVPDLYSITFKVDR